MEKRCRAVVVSLHGVDRGKKVKRRRGRWEDGAVTHSGAHGGE